MHRRRWTRFSETYMFNLSHIRRCRNAVHGDGSLHRGSSITAHREEAAENLSLQYCLLGAGEWKSKLRSDVDLFARSACGWPRRERQAPPRAPSRVHMRNKSTPRERLSRYLASFAVLLNTSICYESCLRIREYSLPSSCMLFLARIS